MVSCLSLNEITSNITAADKIVKVPEMAESISEGTLKQWSKRLFTMMVDYGSRAKSGTK